MVQVWKQARYETSLPRGFEDVCAIGCDPALWTGVAETWVTALRGERSTIAISVQEGSSDIARAWQMNAMVDIAFSYTPPIGAFSVDIIGDDVFIEVATVKRGLMRWDPHYVYVDLGEDFRRKHAQAYPVEETAIVTFTSSAHALDHILACGGSAYLPYRVARPHIGAGRLFQSWRGALHAHDLSRAQRGQDRWLAVVRRFFGSLQAEAGGRNQNLEREFFLIVTGESRDPLNWRGVGSAAR